LKGQKRRGKGFEKSGFELHCKSGGPEFKSHQRIKNYHTDLMFLEFKV